MTGAVSDIKFEELSDRALSEIFRCLIDIEEEEREDTLARLVETSILIEGKKGRGKTLSAVGLTWEMRERFGRQVVAVGTKMGLKEGFGPFEYMPESDFRNEMEKIAMAANEEENAERVASMFEKYGVSILYKTVVFDESFKLFDARRSSDKLIQLFGYFIAQQRHYHVTTILLSPSRDMLDKRVRMQLDWQGRVYHNKYTNIARVRLVSGVDVITYDIRGEKFYDFYDSWNLLGFRRKSLQIKDL